MRCSTWERSTKIHRIIQISLKRWDEQCWTKSRARRADLRQVVWARAWPANKLVGIRAAVCHDTYSAHQGVEHDDMNVLVLGSRIIGVKLAEDLVKAYLGANFTNEERHKRRLAKSLRWSRSALLSDS